MNGWSMEFREEPRVVVVYRYLPSELFGPVGKLATKWCRTTSAKLMVSYLSGSVCVFGTSAELEKLKRPHAPVGAQTNTPNEEP